MLFVNSNLVLDWPANLWLVEVFAVTLEIWSDQIRIWSDSLPPKFHILGQVVWSDPSLTYFWPISDQIWAVSEQA